MIENYRINTNGRIEQVYIIYAHPSISVVTHTHTLPSKATYIPHVR